MTEAEEAAMYRWLRSQNYWESKICCVVNPKKAIKLGHDCPSGDRLDEFIREAMKNDNTDSSSD